LIFTTEEDNKKHFARRSAQDDRRSKIKKIDFISAHLRESAAKIVFSVSP